MAQAEGRTMRRKHMVMLFTGALAAATALGGTAAASSYPPDGSTATTVLETSSGSKPEAVAAPTGELPQTGSDSDASLKIAAGALVAGAGLVVVAKRRRRPADA
jgi:LPXTG-motif cell wall-anchored protein